MRRWGALLRLIAFLVLAGILPACKEDKDDGPLPPPPKVDWQLSFAKSAGGLGDDIAPRMAAWPDGSVLLAGTFGTVTSAPAVFGDGEPNETSLSPTGLADVFIAKYAPDGSLVWAKKAGGSSNESLWGVEVLTDGSSYVTGMFTGSCTFGPGEAGVTTLTATPGGSPDLFIARYNADGTLQWVRQATGPSAEAGIAVRLFSDGTCLCAGGYSGPATFGPGEPNETTLPLSGTFNCFLARYGTDGTLVWAKRVAGTDIDRIQAAATFPDDSFVLAGRFTLSTTFGPGDPNQTTLGSDGGQDIFLARYDGSGVLQWAKRAGGPGPNDQALGLAGAPAGGMLVSGFFTGAATFGPGEPGAQTLTAIGSEDLFLARYAANGTFLWVKRASSSSRVQGAAVAAYPDGGSAVTGYYMETATFGSGEAHETVLPAPVIADFFLARFTADGILQGVVRAGGAGTSEGLDVAVFADGSARAIGTFYQTATFGQGQPAQTSLMSQGEKDTFLVRFTP